MFLIYWMSPFKSFKTQRRLSSPLSSVQKFLLFLNAIVHQNVKEAFVLSPDTYFQPGYTDRLGIIVFAFFLMCEKDV